MDEGVQRGGTVTGVAASDGAKEGKPASFSELVGCGESSTREYMCWVHQKGRKTTTGWVYGWEGSSFGKMSEEGTSKETAITHLGVACTSPSPCTTSNPAPVSMNGA